MKKRRAILWAGLLLLALALHELVAPFERGSWLCTVCGAGEERTEYMGVPVRWSSTRTAYQDWFERNVAHAHSHDWMSTGCHYRRGFLLPGATGCGRSVSGFFVVLPRWPDQPRAVEVARRLAELPRDERRLEHNASTPLIYSLTPHEPEATEGLARWRREHPRWNELLAAK